MGDDTAVGWIAAIIIGGIAGWLAEQFMKSDMGLLMNIVLGIVGAAVASAILSAFGIVLGGRWCVECHAECSGSDRQQASNCQRRSDTSSFQAFGYRNSSRWISRSVHQR